MTSFGTYFYQVFFENCDSEYKIPDWLKIEKPFTEVSSLYLISQMQLKGNFS